MKCEECNTNALEEFLDGELDEQHAAGISAHLVSCRSCALRYEALLDEQTMYAGYERDVAVTPQLWNNVAARIATEEKAPAPLNLFQRIRLWFAPMLIAPRFSPALTAAMMLLAVGATVAVMKFADSGQTPPVNIATAPPSNRSRVDVIAPVNEAPPTATTAPVKPEKNAPVGLVGSSPAERKSAAKSERLRRKDAEQNVADTVSKEMSAGLSAQNDDALRRQRAMVKLVHEAEAKYLAAIRMLSEDVNRRRTTLDPQVAARFDETLASIDRTIAETRRTVVDHGNDPVAVQYMLSAYAKKVEVLREMAALD